jgi:hypothetical protein
MLLVIPAYFLFRTREPFTENNNIQEKLDETLRLVSTIGSGDVPEGTTYVETLTNIPSQNSLKLYLTSFSDRTQYNNAVDIYVPETQRWNNFLAGNQSFFIKKSTSAVLPALLRDNGMPLKNISLEGIQLEALNANGYNLSSFSTSFFIKFINVPENATTELFTIALEAPNYARLSIINNTDICNFSFEVGNGASNTLTTTTNIPSDTITNSTTPPLCITTTLDTSRSGSNVLKIHAGSSVVSGGVATYTPLLSSELVETNSNLPSTLILGNSPMKIHTNPTTLDAQLYGFMYFNNVTTDHENISKYFQKQKSEPVVMLNTINNTLSSNLNNLRSLISNNTLSQGVLQQQLDQCRASVPPVVTAFGHKIDFDGVSSISSQDLRACSILEIRNRINQAVSGTSVAGGSNNARFQLPYTDALASAVAIAP